MSGYPRIMNSDSIYGLGDWLGKKMRYDQLAHVTRIQRLQVNQGEIWDCDFGQNIGHEKNKKRPVIIVSANNINRGAKVLVAPITDASRNMGQNNLPRFPHWYLVYTDSTDRRNWWSSQRVVPQNANTYSFLRKDSVIQLDELRSVSKARLSNKRSTSIESDDLDKIKNILAQRVF